jgi:hypothetical protein
VIPISVMMLAVHLTYHVMSYFGVTDLSVLIFGNFLCWLFVLVLHILLQQTSSHRESF